MLKIRKSKVKVVSIITFLSLLSANYVGLSFYSIPEKVSAADSNGVEEWRTISDIVYMQDMTVDICNKSEIGDHKALIDKRGGGYDNDDTKNSYIVKKLSDDNCWMTQSLNLIDKSITSADSNVLNDYKIPTSTLWSAPSNQDDQQKQNGAYYNSSTGEAYYSWLTATAGTTDTGSVNAVSDICPKGWHLPTGGQNGEFQILYNYGSVKVNQSNSIIPGYILGDDNVDIGGKIVDGSAFFSATGFVYDGAFATGFVGSYWSSTAYNNTGAHHLYLTSTSSTSPTVAWGRAHGGSVRCVNDPASHSTDIPIKITTQSDADISVEVGPTITIDATTGMSGQVDYTKVLEGNIFATISSNLGYTVMLSATNPALTNESNTENTITPVVSTTTLQKGTTGWGIWTGNGTTIETKTYNPITTTEQEYYNTTTPAADGIGTVHTFGVGISVSPSIPNGTYSTVVTVTAANA